MEVVAPGAFGPLLEVTRLACGGENAPGETDLAAICREARSVVGAEACAIYSAEENGELYRLCSDGRPMPGYAPHWRELAAWANRSTVLTFPLGGLDGKGGLMAFAFPENGRPSLAASELARILAAYVALALANKSLREEEARRDREASLLTQVARLVDEAADPEQAVRAVVAKAFAATGRWFAVFLWSGDTPALVAAAPGGPVEAALHAALLADRARGEAYLCASSPLATGEVGRLLAEAGLHDACSYLLGSRDHPLGALLAASPRPPGAASAHLAQALADNLGAALDRARLFRLVERAKREWETTFDAIADGVSIHDPNLTVIRANWAFARLVGLTPQEVVGRKCYELVHGASAPCEGCPALAVLAGQAAASRVREEPRLGNGYISLSVYPLLGAEGQIAGLVHVLHDVSEERRLQDAIVRSERLRALGEMATGVAHSFGNLLVSIQGWAEVLLSESTDESVQRSATAIHQAALDGAEAVRRLQEFARSRRGSAMEPVDVNAIVSDVLEFARPRWHVLATKQQITFEVATDLRPVPPVLGNAAELREVLLNLVFNAIDAMPKGGRLAVATQAKNDRVLMTVSDNGVGMSPSVKERIFDPFFTTKGPGGSGLGLAIAADIVERHGGRLTVKSAVGKGSTFVVDLPSTDQPLASGDGA